MAKKEPYKDWIVRYYGSHNDIPPGHTDGELTELIRCKDCYWYGIVELKKNGTENRRYKPSWCFFWNAGMNEVDFCSLAERKADDER